MKGNMFTFPYSSISKHKNHTAPVREGVLSLPSFLRIAGQSVLFLHFFVLMFLLTQLKVSFAVVEILLMCELQLRLSLFTPRYLAESTDSSS